MTKQEALAKLRAFESLVGRKMERADIAKEIRRESGSYFTNGKDTEAYALRALADRIEYDDREQADPPDDLDDAVALLTDD